MNIAPRSFLPLACCVLLSAVGCVGPDGQAQRTREREALNARVVEIQKRCRESERFMFQADVDLKKMVAFRDAGRITQKEYLEFRAAGLEKIANWARELNLLDAELDRLQKKERSL